MERRRDLRIGRAGRIAGAVASILLVAALASPGSAGGDYRFDATVKCIHWLTEDAASHIKLIRYDTSGESLRIVYRCRSGY